MTPGDPSAPGSGATSATRQLIAEELARNVLTAYDDAVGRLRAPGDAVELWRVWRGPLTRVVTPGERDDAWRRLTARVHSLWAQTHTNVWLKRGVAEADAAAALDADLCAGAPSRPGA